MKLSSEIAGEHQVGLTDEQRAAKLIFLAGRHSQGNVRVEAQFINQAVICHPSWTPETINTDQVNELYTDLLIKLFDGGHHAHVDHFKIDTPQQADAGFKDSRSPTKLLLNRIMTLNSLAKIQPEAVSAFTENGKVEL
jgi:hypothetical protein